MTPKKFLLFHFLLVVDVVRAVEESSDNVQGQPHKTVLNSMAHFENHSWVNNENATLLDIFGEVAKDILTNKMVCSAD